MSASIKPTRAPFVRECNREIHRDRGLANASLPARDGDDAAEVGIRDGRRRRYTLRRGRLLVHHGKRAARRLARCLERGRIGDMNLYFRDALGLLERLAHRSRE
jgi:hypothetical protein